MTLASLLTQTATLIHHEPSGADAEGNPTYGTATTVTYPCRLEQTDSVEELDGERRTTTNLRLFLPPSASGANFEDALQVDGVTYQLVGAPDIERTPRGIHHLELRLTRVGA